MVDRTPDDPWTLAELIDVLDVERVAADRFQGATTPDRGPTGFAPERAVVDGSQLLAQAIVAAIRQEPGRVVKSPSSGLGPASQWSIRALNGKSIR